MSQDAISNQSSGLMRWWSNLSTGTRRIWAAVILLGGPSAIYAAIIPHVDVSAGVIGSDMDALRTEFVIANNNPFFSMHNVLMHCEIIKGTMRFSAEGNYIDLPDRPPMSQTIPELEATHIASRNCGAGLMMVPFPASFDITVTFDWPLYRSSRVRGPFHFTAIKGNDGHIHIQRDTN